MKKIWIKKVKIKRGALSRQLGIPVKKNIPVVLLKRIVMAKAGETVRNPTKTGKKVIKVTRLIERRSILALNLKNISRK